ITLLVIGVAGFGRRISWKEDKIAPPGYTMTFKDALYEVSHRLLWRVMFPEWMLRWGTPTMRHFLRANKELEKYLVEMIAARQAATVKDSERRDLFSSLLDANDAEEDSAAKLSDDALLGNVFLFLVAGYETTAHTLAYAFILLALYQDEQEAFYQNIKSVLPADGNPTYESINSLSYSLAVMNETLRLFPPVVFIPKVSVDDTTFTTTNAAGEKRTIPIPRNTYLTICTPALHQHPRYWDEPEKFKPVRFLGNYNRDAFLPFSAGPRGCIGRGFAETEGVAVLTLIVSRYKVEVREEAQFKGETFEARKKRLLKSRGRNSSSVAGFQPTPIYTYLILGSRLSTSIVAHLVRYCQRMPVYLLCKFSFLVFFLTISTYTFFLSLSPCLTVMLEGVQVYVLLGTFAAIFILHKLTAFRREERAIGNWPGFRTLFNDRWLVPPFRVKWLTPGLQWPFYTKYDDFANAGWDVITAVNVFPRPKADIYIADPKIVKEIIGARARFPKPTEQYAVMRVFGTNLLATEGDEWKHQRKIVAPAFSERNNRLVWDETVRVLEDLFQNEWGPREVVDVNHIMDITVPITLLVIGVAGFGRRISWNEDKIPPAGYTMTFKDALYEVSHRLLWRLLFPEWMLRWGTSTMRNLLRANKELEKYLVEMIEARRSAAVKEERNDLFSSLLDANEAEEDNMAKVSDDALLGNVFLFLVAGYETTAHTLAYAFILLALYQDEQEAFYQNIKTILPANRNPTYEDFSSLSYSLAVMNETLRLFPPVVSIPKVNVDDTTFTTTNAAGEKRTIFVPRNAYITICTPSLHYNPRYWDEPEKFKPARFLGNYNRDAFLPFSGGPRGCIGRGFAETEGVAVLTLIVSRYKVEVREEAQFKGETFEARKKRVLKSLLGLTVYPERAPLVFKRR
ncbi:cytochrome P450, partial [Ganoderma leucocontextum]